jgi:hypothetical protein
VTLVLVPVAPGKLLAAPAAASYRRALAAGCPPGLTSAYRTPAAQAALRAAYLRNPTEVAYAAPVELSEHVEGNAVDVPKGGPREWMAAHGAAHGWVRTDRREDWHYAYRLVLDRHLTDQAQAVPTPPREDDDMTRDIITTDPRNPSVYWLLGNGLTTKRHLHSDAERVAENYAGAVQVENGTITAATIDCAAWTPCHNVLGDGSPVPGGPLAP